MTSVRLRPSLAPSLAVLSLAAVTLAACGDAPPVASAPAEPSASTAAPGSGEKEVPALTPRVLVADAGGLRLLDATSGKTLHTHPSSDFLRLSDAGDGRHVVVADGDTFRVYDGGLELKAHGDHDHAYTYNPGLTGTAYAAAHAGHVVPHSGTRRSSATATARSSSCPPTRSPGRTRRSCAPRPTPRTTAWRRGSAPRGC